MLRRSESISIAIEATTFGYIRGKVCHERAISLMSCLALIYTSTAYSTLHLALGVHHTGRPNGRPVGITASAFDSADNLPSFYVEREFGFSWEHNHYMRPGLAVL